MKVYVLENAFWNMLLSSVEVFPNECLGLLIGSMSLDTAVVHHSVTFQTAERKQREVSFPRHAVHRNVRSFLEECLPHQHVLGDFHSHTRTAPQRLSVEDQSTMEHGQVYVIIQVYKKKRIVPWRYNATQTLLSGTTQQFYFKIGAWYKEGDAARDRFRLANLVCQFTPGLMG